MTDHYIYVTFTHPAFKHRSTERRDIDVKGGAYRAIEREIDTLRRNFGLDRHLLEVAMPPGVWLLFRTDPEVTRLVSAVGLSAELLTLAHVTGLLEVKDAYLADTLPRTAAPQDETSRSQRWPFQSPLEHWRLAPTYAEMLRMEGRSEAADRIDTLVAEVASDPDREILEAALIPRDCLVYKPCSRGDHSSHENDGRVRSCTMTLCMCSINGRKDA